MPSSPEKKVWSKTQQRTTKKTPNLGRKNETKRKKKVRDNRGHAHLGVVGGYYKNRRRLQHYRKEGIQPLPQDAVIEKLVGQ